MGWSNNSLFQVLIVTGSTGSGVFVYSPSPGLGKLVASIAANASKDPYGNAYVAGVTSYTGGNQAASLSTGELILWTAAGPGGPWNIQSTLSFSGGALSLHAQAGSGAAVNIAADTGLNINMQTALVALLGATINNGLAWTGNATGDKLTLSNSGGAPLLQATNTGAGGTPAIRATVNAQGDLGIGYIVSGDTNNRVVIDSALGGAAARIRFGSGAVAPDTILARPNANQLQVQGADLDIASVGRGLQVAEQAGGNARMGTQTLVAGSVIVLNNTVTASTRIFLTAQNTGGTPGALRVSARTAGTSFTITSTSGTDTSLVAWLLVEPG
jgi:hypothetical protein